MNHSTYPVNGIFIAFTKNITVVTFSKITKKVRNENGIRSCSYSGPAQCTHIYGLKFKMFKIFTYWFKHDPRKIRFLV